MALFSVSSKVLTSRVVLSFVGSAWILFLQATWKKKELFLTGIENSTYCSALVRKLLHVHKAAGVAFLTSSGRF